MLLAATVFDGLLGLLFFFFFSGFPTASHQNFISLLEPPSPSLLRLLSLSEGSEVIKDKLLPLGDTGNFY